MPVVSPSRYSTSGSSALNSLSSSTYRSTLNTTSSYEKPYYRTSSGTYVSSTLRTNYGDRTTEFRSRFLDTDGKRERKTSLVEYSRGSRAPSVTDSDSGISSRYIPRSERSESRSRDISSSRSDSTRTISDPLPRNPAGTAARRNVGSTASLASSAADLYNKYSPANYIPLAQRLSTSVSGQNNGYGEISRSKSISNDIGRPPAFDSRSSRKARSSAVTSVAEHRPALTKHVRSSSSSSQHYKETSPTPSYVKKQQNGVKDTNGNDVPPSVAEIRKRFDSKMAVTKLPANDSRYARSSMENYMNQLKSCHNGSTGYTKILPKDDKPVPVHLPSLDKINKWETSTSRSNSNSDISISKTTSEPLLLARPIEKIDMSVSLNIKLPSERVPLAVKSQLDPNNPIGKILEKSTVIQVEKNYQDKNTQIENKNNVTSIEIGPDSQKPNLKHTNNFASYIQISRPIVSGNLRSESPVRVLNGIDSPKIDDESQKLSYIDEDRLILESDVESPSSLNAGFENKTFEHENYLMRRCNDDDLTKRPSGQNRTIPEVETKVCENNDIDFKIKSESFQNRGLDELDFRTKKGNVKNRVVDDVNFKTKNGNVKNRALDEVDNRAKKENVKNNKDTADSRIKNENAKKRGLNDSDHKIKNVNINYGVDEVDFKTRLTEKADMKYRENKMNDEDHGTIPTEKNKSRVLEEFDFKSRPTEHVQVSEEEVKKMELSAESTASDLTEDSSSETPHAGRKESDDEDKTELAGGKYGGGGATGGSQRRSLERDPISNGSLHGGSKSSGLNGLRNIGNTCFMNSVVQCLSNTRPLLEYIAEDRLQAEINTTVSCMKGALIKAFATVIKELWREGDRDGVVNTTALKSQVQRFAPRFMGYSQQDAQEFLRYLLEGLHEDVNRVTARPKPIHTEIDDNLSDAEKATEAWSRYLRMEQSRVGDIFMGQLKSTLRCTHCNHDSVTFDPFWDLSLPIPSRTGNLKLQQCLAHFTREEELDGDEKPLRHGHQAPGNLERATTYQERLGPTTCSKCGVRRKCLKWFTVQRFPRVLVLHLKRFSPTERFRGKLNVLVEFPLTALDMSPYAATRGREATYNLYAVSNHSGTTYSGHYTAYCKHPYTSEWHEYNDSRVSTISRGSVVSSEAYVLFYELCGAGAASHL